MAFDPVRFVRTRSREEWQLLAVERWTDARIWVQENGEKAAIVALVLGVVLVLFFRVVLAVVAVGLIVGFAGWNMALPAGEHKAAASGSTSNDDKQPPTQ